MFLWLKLILVSRVFLFQKPLYLRPDRQENFGGIPSYDWPDTEEDRDTLTVDRVGDNGDGGEHRFYGQTWRHGRSFFRS